MTPATAPQVQSSLYEVGCLDCGRDFTFAKVASNMKCFCGSDNLVFEEAGELAPAHSDGVIAIHYPKGLIGLVGPDAQGFHYSLSRGDDIYTAGWSPAEEGAKQIVEHLAPLYAGARISATATWVVAADDENPFGKKKKEDDDKGGDDKGGNETHPPVGDDKGGEAAPAPAAGTPSATPPEGSTPPGAVPVDPNAPPAPGADPNAVVDPLLQVMDTAQQQVDAAVDQANQLGHDAKEVAYDVDQLFSNWRCQNCQIEGGANISDDGQVSLDGDLFDNQPCAAPAPADPNQNAENQVPQQNQQNQLPQGAPAADGQIPATQQNIPSQTASKTADVTNIPQVADDDKSGPDQRNVADQQSGEIEKAERLTAMVEQILDTNPGMNVQAARRVAEATLAKFPSLAS